MSNSIAINWESSLHEEVLFPNDHFWAFHLFWSIDTPLQRLLSRSLWGTQSHRDQGGSSWAAETRSPYERAENASYSSTTKIQTTQENMLNQMKQCSLGCTLSITAYSKKSTEHKAHSPIQTTTQINKTGFLLTHLLLLTQAVIYNITPNSSRVSTSSHLFIK